jgi:hypothetical protein
MRPSDRAPLLRCGDFVRRSERRPRSTSRRDRTRGRSSGTVSTRTVPVGEQREFDGNNVLSSCDGGFRTRRRPTRGRGRTPRPGRRITPRQMAFGPVGRTRRTNRPAQPSRRAKGRQARRSGTQQSPDVTALGRTYVPFFDGLASSGALAGDASSLVAGLSSGFAGTFSAGAEPPGISELNNRTASGSCRRGPSA